MMDFGGMLLCICHSFLQYNISWWGWSCLIAGIVVRSTNQESQTLEIQRS
jgi:hypothetical protein